MMPANVPDYVERKGSLFLRSHHMNYSRATLNSNWHQAREAEPKDYDISLAPTRDLHKATYQSFGNATNKDFPETTYQTSWNQILRKPSVKEDYDEREQTKHMNNKDRETGTPEKDYGSVLPGHHPDYDKRHLETTHTSDYKAPYPYTPTEEKPGEDELPDNTMAYKRCQSQFTDKADYRRWGRNTWQDETGLYHNSHFKLEAPAYSSRNPILEAFK